MSDTTCLILYLIHSVSSGEVGVHLATKMSAAKRAEFVDTVTNLSEELEQVQILISQNILQLQIVLTLCVVAGG